MEELQAEAAAWVSTVTGIEVDGGEEFAAQLKSGVTLCKLVNALRPGAAKCNEKARVVASPACSTWRAPTLDAALRP